MFNFSCKIHTWVNGMVLFDSRTLQSKSLVQFTKSTSVWSKQMMDDPAKSVGRYRLSINPIQKEGFFLQLTNHQETWTECTFLGERKGLGFREHCWNPFLTACTIITVFHCWEEKGGTQNPISKSHPTIHHKVQSTYKANLKWSKEKREDLSLWDAKSHQITPIPYLPPRPAECSLTRVSLSPLTITFLLQGKTILFLTRSMMCCPTHQMHPSGCRSSVNGFTRIMKKPTREDAGEGSTCDGV